MIKIYYLILFLLFFLTSCSIGDGFRIEGNQVIFERPWNTGHGTQIIKVNADVKSFETLGDNNLVWARDKNYVFNEHHILKFLDRNSFEAINNYLGKDKYSVVCGLKLIEEADALSFRVKEYQDEAGKTIVLGIDKNAAYECDDSGYVRIVSDSIDHFRPIKNGFYRDKTKVWWHSIQLEKVDVDRFRVIGSGYATDGELVFFRGREIKDADAATFNVVSKNQAKDKEHHYIFESRID